MLGRPRPHVFARRVARYLLLLLGLSILALLTVGRLTEPAEPGLGQIVCCCQEGCAQALFIPTTGDPPPLRYQDGTPLYWASPGHSKIAADDRGTQTGATPAPRPGTSPCCVGLRP